MKRLLIAVVLAMVVLAVVAAPAFAYLDSQAGAPVGAPHAVVADAHHHAAGIATGKATRVVMIHGRRGLPSEAVPMSKSATGVSIALLLALVIGGAAYGLATDRRKAPAKSAKPVRLPAFKPAAHHEHKAA